MPLALDTGHTIYSIAERPDLGSQIGEIDRTVWPKFMLEDPVANKYWHRLYIDFPGNILVLCEQEGGGERVVAAAFTIPLTWNGTLEDLPDGWDGVLTRGFEGKDAGVTPNCLSALSISVALDKQGSGLSSTMLKQMRRLAQESGFSALIAPVRPNMKPRYPLTPIERYITWTREDGSLFDPWLRVHSRLGARIVKIAPRSMVIPGTVAEWEEWAGMRFPESGLYVVPGALEPVQIDVEADRGLYVEPNVWMLHQIGATQT